MNVKPAVPEKQQARSANPLGVSESNVSICALTMNKISDHFSIFTADVDFDSAPGVNPFSAVA